DSRGSTSKVDILVAGGVNRTFNQQTGTTAARVTTPGNEQPYQVQLRVCNEKAPAGCTLSGVQNVQTYGRLDGMLNDIGPAAVNGKSLTWTISGTSNGDPAQLAIRVNGGAAQIVDLGAVGAFTHPFSMTADDFEQEIRIDVTLQDPSPGGRGFSSKGRSDRSGPPPPPSVVVQKGAACDDDDPAVQDCKQLPWQPDCVEASCAFVRLDVRDLRAGESVTCGVDNSGDPSWWDENRGFQINGNGDWQIPYYYRSGTTTAACTWRGQTFLAASRNW
ncbi:MAG TPA: hypothetical protein VLA55_12025, partial [Ornithinibacter sp.]|nr:hypothetical protein [Ornithinibacter sp.]